VNENRQLTEEKNALEAENEHLTQQLQEKNQQLLESATQHQRVARALDPSRAATPASTATTASSSTPSRENRRAGNRGFHLF
jgi:hypothetical protein